MSELERAKRVFEDCQRFYFTFQPARPFIPLIEYALTDLEQALLDLWDAHQSGDVGLAKRYAAECKKLKWLVESYTNHRKN